jgi:hypothetical protein
MSQKACQCPFCKTYILGDYCFICKKDIRYLTGLFQDKDLNIFKNIFGEKNE